MASEPVPRALKSNASKRAWTSSRLRVHVELPEERGTDGVADIGTSPVVDRDGDVLGRDVMPPVGRHEEQVARPDHGFPVLHVGELREPPEVGLLQLIQALRAANRRYKDARSAPPSLHQLTLRL